MRKLRLCLAGHATSEDLATGKRLAPTFRHFDRAFEEYPIVQKVLQHGGGLPAMFDVVGKVKDPTGLVKTLSELGKSVAQELCNGLSVAQERTKNPAMSMRSILEHVDAHADAGAIPRALSICRAALSIWEEETEMATEAREMFLQIVDDLRLEVRSFSSCAVNLSQAGYYARCL